MTRLAAALAAIAALAASTSAEAAIGGHGFAGHRAIGRAPPPRAVVAATPAPSPLLVRRSPVRQRGFFADHRFPGQRLAFNRFGRRPVLGPFGLWGGYWGGGYLGDGYGGDTYSGAEPAVDEDADEGGAGLAASAWNVTPPACGTWSAKAGQEIPVSCGRLEPELEAAGS